MKVHENEFKDVMPTREILRVNKEEKEELYFVCKRFLCNSYAIEARCQWVSRTRDTLLINMKWCFSYV